MSKEFKILAVDPAEKTGWAVSTSLYGMEDFKLKRDQSFGYKLIKFKKFIDDVVKTQGITFIAYERPSGFRPAAIMSHAKFVAMLEEYSVENNIPTIGYSAKEIKKHATGNGNANKDMMIKAAIRLYKKPIKDDNIADALHILSLAQKDLLK